MTAFVGVMLPVLLSLGSWQLQRAEEKRFLEDRYFDALAALPTAADAKPAASIPAFTRLRLTGRYLPDKQYLVDNQVHDGQVGYWAVTPFADLDGRVWLLNRGFQAAPPQREELPELAVPTGQQTLVAMVWPEFGLPPTWQADAPMGSYPRRVQRLDLARLAAAENAELVQLRLEAGQPGSLTPASLTVDFNPAGHTGYAVQWFGLAATLLAGFVILGLRNGAERNTAH